MNPYVKLWWLLHRGLLDPEIAKALSRKQKQDVYKRAMTDEQANLFARRQLPFTIAYSSAIIVFAFCGPMRWLMDWAKQVGGRMMLLPTFWAVGVFAGMATWWLFRRRYALIIFRTVRSYGYDVCTECGYWLRGLGEDVKHCPECGAKRADAANADSN